MCLCQDKMNKCLIVATVTGLMSTNPLSLASAAPVLKSSCAIVQHFHLKQHIALERINMRAIDKVNETACACVCVRVFVFSVITPAVI